jgi:very-short-patch-repair endonuclease
MIEKYGQVNGEIRYREWLYNSTKHLQNHNGVSKSSQELFWLIYESLDNTENIYFHELNEEYKFYQHLPDKIKLHRVDFKKEYKIIEFDCEYWHDEEKDKLRDDFLKSHNYQVLRVRYEDWVEDNQSVLNYCINFLKEVNEIT